MYDHISHHSKHEKAVRYIYILSPGPAVCADRYYNMRLAITAVVTHFFGGKAGQQQQWMDVLVNARHH